MAYRHAPHAAREASAERNKIIFILTRHLRVRSDALSAPLPATFAWCSSSFRKAPT
jgi:hypothetical protein